MSLKKEAYIFSTTDSKGRARYCVTQREMNGKGDICFIVNGFREAIKLQKTLELYGPCELVSDDR